MARNKMRDSGRDLDYLDRFRIETEGIHTGGDIMTYFSNRRTFLKHSAAWAISIPALPALAGQGVNPEAKANGHSVADELQHAFLEPPEAAWPWVYWMVTDGMLTREGITADLEAMHRVGVRGLIYMENALFIPTGPVRFMTPQWREMVQHAVKEATRLGITMNMNDDGGYSGSGGPWITPELSMQMLTFSETTLEGPRHFAGTLRQPKTIRDYYRDIAVLAFPTPAGEAVRMAERSPVITYGLERKSFDAAPLLDGEPETVAVVPPPATGLTQYLNIEFPQPYTVQSLTIGLDLWNTAIPAALEVSTDGTNYQTVREFSTRWPMSSVNFPKVTTRYFRLRLTILDPASDWVFHRFDKGIPLSQVELQPVARLEDISGKAAYMRHDGFSTDPAGSLDSLVPLSQVTDLSGNMTSDGRLSWDVPAGKWTVLRIGHTSTGKENHPAPLESRGLECDKLSKKAIEVQFSSFLGKLLEDQAAAGGSSIKMAHIDSWEVGSQNWTPGFREEFMKRRGYDLIRFLPALTSRPVESREMTERFLWDLRRTVADLLLENYAGHMREICNQHGLKLSIECYGDGPYPDVAYAGRVDVPMCEFWTGSPAWTTQLMSYCKEMASAGHVYGKPIIAAESFTSGAVSGKWQNHPFMLKPLGDKIFTMGTNRFVFHRYSMQPWLDRKPGMTCGPFGLHYERTNTWWEQSRAWHHYVARCQALLQRGQFIADIACMGSENAPYIFPDPEMMDPPIPPGYDFDDVPPEVVLEQMTVRDGRLVLPSGMSYRVLVLPPGGAMTPALAAKIRDLASAGATLVGPPPTESPSLADYPHGDGEVQGIAAELWGDCDGESLTEHRFGKGKVVWGKPLADVLTESHTPPDFACREVAVNEQIRYIHRNGQGFDIYFVASAFPEAKRFQCTFRVQGKKPELWWPDTGRIEPIAVYEQTGNSTIVPLALDPYGSVFVVFRGGQASSDDRMISVRRDGVEISGVAPRPYPTIQLQHEAVDVVFGPDDEYYLEVSQQGKYDFKTSKGRMLSVEVAALPDPFEISGPWELEFPKGWKAPDRVTLERLISWTDHPHPGVKYFSGTATYHRQFEWPAGFAAHDRAFYLDLGRVEVIAEAKLNGHDLGILWKPPFRVDITEALKAGANELVVNVVNLWPNRLIGDDMLPPDADWSKYFAPGVPVPPTHGWVLKNWPQWLLQGKPSPTGHVTFASWKLWSKDDPLMESGLLGPVRIVATARRTVR